MASFETAIFNFASYSLYHSDYLYREYPINDFRLEADYGCLFKTCDRHSEYNSWCERNEGLSFLPSFSPRQRVAARAFVLVTMIKTMMSPTGVVNRYEACKNIYIYILCVWYVPSGTLPCSRWEASVSLATPTTLLVIRRFRLHVCFTTINLSDFIFFNYF